MYKIRPLTKNDLDLCDSTFQDFYRKDAIIDFKKDDWTKIVVENLFFFEEKNLDSFLSLLLDIKCTGIVVMPIVTKNDHEKRNVNRYQCIEFDNVPPKDVFFTAIQGEYFDYTGGIVFTKCNTIAIFSDIDNSLLYIGYNKLIEQQVLLNFHMA